MEHMHYAATMAGMGFSNSGNGVVHTIASKIGPAFKLTHGLACGIALPYSIRYNSAVAGDLLTSLARTVVYKGEKGKEGADYLVDRVNDLYSKLGVPSSLKQAGIPEDSYSKGLAEFVESSIAFPPTLVNPRKSKKQDLEALYKACYYGDYSKL
jgi:alcohol dehydrogenase class IV